MSNIKDDGIKKSVTKHIRLTTSEADDLDFKLEQSGLSFSQFARSVLTNHKVKSLADKKLFLELTKTKNDLAKIGNLFKIGLKDNKPYNEEQQKYIINQIDDAIRQTMECIKKLSDAISDSKKD